MNAKELSCCQITRRIREHWTVSNWKKEASYIGTEFTNKVFMNDLGCQECKVWFEEKEREQIEFLKSNSK